MKKSINTNVRGDFSTNDFNTKLLFHINAIRNGSITIVKQDGYPIQFNISEKYICGDYLC